MIKLIVTIAAVLLTYSYVFAGFGYQVIGVVGVVAEEPGGCDSCSGDLALSWYMEGTDATDRLDVTTGTPCGCSDGDETFSLTSSSISDSQSNGTGSWSLYVNGSSSGANITESISSVISSTSGTVQFDIYFTTIGDHILFWGGENASTDYIRVKLTGDELDGRWETNNSGTNVDATVDANLTTGTWYTVVLKWRTGDYSPNIYISVNGVSTSSDVNITDWDSAATFFQIGYDGTGAASFYIDNFKVWSTWQN